MKKNIIIGIGAVAVVAILISIYLLGFFTPDFFETPTVFGTWGQDIQVLYEDGTTESLRVLMEKPLSTLTYNNKAIYGFEYAFNVKATGTDYTDVTINIESFSVKVNIKSGSTVKYTTTWNWLAKAYTIALDSAFHSLGGVSSLPAKVKMDEIGLSAGTYTIEFVPSGSIKFNGNPGGDVQTATLPSSVSFSVVYTKGTLSVVVDNGVTTWGP